MINDANRTHLIDKRCDDDIKDVQFVNHFFLRFIAKDRHFTKIDFKYTIFDSCYLRNCTFDSCDFTGCRFLATNLSGSTFTGSKFDYCSFDKTQIDSSILDTECPALENLKVKFARSLRMNFQQLGDACGVNKAITVELQANEIHLHKAWASNESYYRRKYSGWKRVSAYLEWLNFKTLDFVWGNGESAFKLLRSMVILLAGIALVDIFFYSTPSIKNYIRALIDSPQILFGVLVPNNYSRLYLTIILCVRLVAFGFFMSIIVKRLNRR